MNCLSTVHPSVRNKYFHHIFRRNYIWQPLVSWCAASDTLLWSHIKLTKSTCTTPTSCLPCLFFNIVSQYRNEWRGGGIITVLLFGPAWLWFLELTLWQSLLYGKSGKTNLYRVENLNGLMIRYHSDHEHKHLIFAKHRNKWTGLAVAQWYI